MKRGDDYGWWQVEVTAIALALRLQIPDRTGFPEGEARRIADSVAKHQWNYYQESKQRRRKSQATQSARSDTRMAECHRLLADGMRPAEIGQQLGITKRRVNQLLTESASRLPPTAPVTTDFPPFDKNSTNSASRLLIAEELFRIYALYLRRQIPDLREFPESEASGIAYSVSNYQWQYQPPNDDDDRLLSAAVRTADSDDLRDDCRYLYGQTTMTQREIAQFFGITERTVRRKLRRD